MTDFIIKLIISIALLGVPALASAEISQGTADRLMRTSGLWSQLTDVSKSVLNGIDQSPMRSRLSAEDASRLERAADSAFSAARMRQRVGKAIAQKLSDQEASEIAAWYAGATGQMLTGLEEAYSASITGSGLAEVLAEGNAALENASQNRQILISRLITATRAAEFQVDAIKHVTMGTMQGMESALNVGASAPTAQLQRHFETQRPAMVASAKGVHSAISAAIYATVTDQELEQYVEFLSTPSGRQFTAVFMEAIDIAFSHAAQEFGKAIVPKAKAKSKVTG